ncbi:MAG: hypothetical protein OHK0029_21140 [Armatimonadaceae bacterium]
MDGVERGTVRHEVLPYQTLCRTPVAGDETQVLLRDTTLELESSTLGVLAHEPQEYPTKKIRNFWLSSANAKPVVQTDFALSPKVYRVGERVYWRESEELHSCNIVGTDHQVQKLPVKGDKIVRLFTDEDLLYLAFFEDFTGTQNVGQLPAKRDLKKQQRSYYVARLYPERPQILGKTTLIGHDFDYGDGENRDISLDVEWMSRQPWASGGGYLYFKTVSRIRGPFKAIEVQDSLKTETEFRRIRLPQQ